VSLMFERPKILIDEQECLKRKVYEKSKRYYFSRLGFFPLLINIFVQTTEIHSAASVNYLYINKLAFEYFFKISAKRCRKLRFEA
jgi:hypothetical protein